MPRPAVVDMDYGFSPKAATVRRKALEGQADFAVIGKENSEKARLDRMRRKEVGYKRVVSGVYKVFHEEAKQYLPWYPAPWTMQAIQDYFAQDGIRQLFGKSRQTYATSGVGVLQADNMMNEPGSVGLIWNMNYNEAHATLQEKVIKVLKETFPGITGNEKIFSMSQKKVEYHRQDGHGGSSTIYAGEVGGRGSTPSFVLATEFPIVCGEDPVRAEKFLAANLAGAEFGTIILEGTASDIGGGGLMFDMFDIAIERQRAGYNATRKDFHAYFFAWHQKPNLIVPDMVEEGDGGWDPREKIEKPCLDYFRKLESLPEHMVGRDIVPGGIYLSEGQKRWYYKTWLTSKNRSFAGMNADYPSVMTEAKSSGSRPQYLQDVLAKAKSENRIGEYPPLAGVPVQTAWDIGWDDETVCIFFQRDDSRQGGVGGLPYWRILDAFAVNHWHTPAMIEKVRSYQWHQRLGVSGAQRVWLPHDGANATHGQQKITGEIGGTVYRDFSRAGFDMGKREGPLRNPRPKPDKKMITFGKIREIFPRVFFDEVGTKVLRGHLDKIRRRELRIDKVLSEDLVQMRGKDWHDAFGVFADVALTMEKFRGGEDVGSRDYLRERGAAPQVRMM